MDETFGFLGFEIPCCAHLRLQPIIYQRNTILLDTYHDIRRVADSTISQDSLERRPLGSRACLI